ncbi:adaptor protein MecA [Oribacterium asaccharolyticum]|jgi:negative regulator of genetic competence sporulation and motility family protein|uniref:adaptor protein MecA n=1 Tax=Oribacterium asaccharolyticum TaxID=1501332 RepID=UPI0028F023D5|nr:adaptor protein MecA [Oribacterium asaccharolyticum]
MKIEKIDDNSIKCTLSSLDLSSRNLNLRDMTYGSQAAKRLFNEMMQKAKEEVGFSIENTPLMIEAVPLQGGAVQLIISKVDDPEELDTRFSKFSAAGSGQNGWISELATQILEGAQGLMKQLKETEEEPGVAEEKKESGDEGIRLYRFRTLDRVIDAAKAVSYCDLGANSLYKAEDKKGYYVSLHSKGDDIDSLNRAANLLLEYGERVNGGSATEAYYKEHMEQLIQENALQKLKTV